MPSSAQILRTLTDISNEAITAAIVWHLAVGAALIALAWGWKPRPRLFAGLTTLLPASVSLLAFAWGNPFNGAMFAVLCVALWVIAWRTRDRAPEPPPLWASALGVVLIAFAWAYPHFLEDRPAFVYLVASPLGLVPCPTLSLLVGLSLAGYRPAGRAWPLTVATFGLFYGLFGALRLGVTIDVVLLAGAAVLAAHALGRPHAALPPGPAHAGHRV